MTIIGVDVIKNVIFKKLLIFQIFLIFFLLTNQIGLSEEVQGSFIYISKSGDGNFSNIQEGIDSASHGDTIYVYNGTYYENVVIDKSIIIIGEDKNSTIIDGRNTGNVIKINADNVTIKGFTIQHSGLIYPNSGINLSSNYNFITNNLILSNYYGITLYHSSGNIIQDNIIQNDDHCGIYISKSSNNLIVFNIIKLNTYNGLGIYYSSNNNTIQSNTLNNNGFCGVNIRVSSNNNITNNNIFNNSIGIHLPSLNYEYNNNFSNNDINIEREFDIFEYDILLITGLIAFIGIFVTILFLKIRKKDDKKKNR